ncbi:MAG: hypothetical protein HN352_04935 [Bacteroidetes bacterium]|jgi:hypothetical protein|nr:hypothetical protein [Bacteroidota bacterium]MBT3750318.1 hypothetical protein [Bacteroidota bacterium]MBT4400355.1 hypothetical protein [Bacteroidota bacterium]MBT4411309.1 hypothetical protein [Bacteroidota bacterium]MBT5426516.1 hypothetical protein [Bacteroidota bacterium]
MTLLSNTCWKICFFISLWLCHLSSHAQYWDAQEEESLRDRVFFGGSFGARLGTVTHLDLSPLIAYRLTKKLSVGTGAVFQYLADRRYAEPYNTGIYGAKLFGDYKLLQSVFAHSEIEILNLDSEYYGDPVIRNIEASPRFWNTAVFVGGGYQLNIGSRSSVMVLVLWNINQSTESPYKNPVLRLGFNF